MPDLSDALLDAQRDLLETSQLIGMKSVETGVRLVELNVRLLNDWHDSAAAGQGGSPVPDLSALGDYLQQLGGLWMSAGGDIARLLQRQAEGLQNFFSAMFSAGLQVPGTVAAAQHNSAAAAAAA